MLILVSELVRLFSREMSWSVLPWGKSEWLVRIPCGFLIHSLLWATRSPLTRLSLYRPLKLQLLFSLAAITARFRINPQLAIFRLLTRNQLLAIIRRQSYLRFVSLKISMTNSSFDSFHSNFTPNMCFGHHYLTRQFVHQCVLQ